jgi:hypothetical protein
MIGDVLVGSATEERNPDGSRKCKKFIAAFKFLLSVLSDNENSDGAVSSCAVSAIFLKSVA